MKYTYLFFMPLFALLLACKTNTSTQKITLAKTQETVTPQKVYIDDTLHHLVGTVGQDFSIVMNIFINGNDVNGSMYYKKIGKYIYLKGKIDDYGHMDLTGYLRNGQKTEYFTGKYNNRVYKGEWSNASHNTKFDFSLERTNSQWVLLDSFKYEIVDSLQFGDSIWAHYKNSVVIVYPKAYPIPEAGEKINNALMNEILGNAPSFRALKDSMEQDKLQWIQDCKSYEEEGLSVYGANKEYTEKVKVIYSKNLLLSIKDEVYDYEGGAHGMFSDVNYNFDLYSGNKLSLNDVIAAPKNQFIEDIVIPQLDKYFRNNYQESIQDAVFDINSIGLPDQFYFTNTGIGFYYEPYNIAPFVFGMPGFEVSYDSLRPYLSEFIKKRLGLQ